MGGTSKLKTVFLSPPPSSCKGHWVRGGARGSPPPACFWLEQLLGAWGPRGVGSPHGALEKPLGPGGVQRCDGRTLYVSIIINPSALTVCVGFFAFQGLRRAAGGGGRLWPRRTFRCLPCCRLISGSRHVYPTKHLHIIPKMGTPEGWRNVLVTLVTELPQKSRPVRPVQDRKGGPFKGSANLVATDERFVQSPAAPGGSGPVSTRGGGAGSGPGSGAGRPARRGPWQPRRRRRRASRAGGLRGR